MIFYLAVTVTQYAYNFMNVSASFLKNLVDSTLLKASTEAKIEPRLLFLYEEVLLGLRS